MIRKPKPSSALWGYVLFGVGLSLSLLLWWVRFAGSYWDMGNGTLLHISTGNALTCLAPWELMSCRNMFADTGFTRLPDLYRLLSIVHGPWFLGTIALAIALWLRYVSQPYQIVLSGPSIGDADDLVRQLKAEKGDRGLEIRPNWTMTRTREANHFLMVAGSGGGKTNAMMWFLKAIDERGDKKILYADKTNFIGRLPKREETAEVALLAPHDLRSWVWDIAKEAVDEAACIRIASYLVKPEKGQNAFFSDAARAIVTAVLLFLRERKGSSWTWADLITVCEFPLEALRSDVGPSFRPSLTYLNADRKLVSSITSTVQNAMLQLRLLAIAWGDEKDRKRISVRDFILSEGGPRTMIVGRSGDYSDMSEKWISIFFSICADTIRSETFQPARGDRLWFFLDELAQLPAIPRIGDLLATGREKGVPVVLGLQDLHQIKQKYGDDEVQTWFTNIGTKFYGLVRSGETQMLLSKLLGEARVREKKYVPSGGGSYDAGNERTEAVMQPSDFLSELGNREGRGGKDGYVLMIVADVGRHPCLVPVSHYPLAEQRPSYIPAKWVESGPAMLAEIDAKVAANKKRIASGPAPSQGVQAAPQVLEPTVVDEDIQRPVMTVKQQMPRDTHGASQVDPEVQVFKGGLDRLASVRKSI